MLYASDNDDVYVNCNDVEHDHDKIGTASNYGIDEPTKIVINKLSEMRLKPKDMLTALGEKAFKNATC